MIDLLARLVRISSVSGEEAEVADALAAELVRRGFAPRRSGHNLFFEAVPGAPGPRLLFNSHIDTVPACAGWSVPPLEGRARNGRLTGLGANDAKGCVVALLEAAMQFRDHAARKGEPPRGSLWVAFTAAEETGGEGLSTVLPLLPKMDAAVVGEPTVCRPVVAQKGLLILRGESNGVAGHAAHGETGGARNAVHAAARDIAALAAAPLGPEHPLLGAPSLQVTGIEGGHARNAVPDRCEFWIDVRTNPGPAPEAILASLQALTQSRLTIHSSRFRAMETSREEAVVQAAEKSAGASGEGSRTTSDWVFLSDVPAVKIGPGDTARSHRADEYLTEEELRRGAEVYFDLARSYFALARAGAAACR